ncbi:MAG TPA: hypothetical protein VEL47_07400 [Myxococcota bacterium]|nr:hypothetical protein [Myxococcota bacterium]
MRTFLVCEVHLGFLLLCVLLGCAVAYGQEVPAVRARSFGGAYRAVTSANDAIYFNPAGLIKYKHVAIESDYLVNFNDETHQLAASVVDSATTSWGLGLAYNRTFGPHEENHPSHLIDLALAMPLAKDFFFLGSSLYYTYVPNAKEYRHFFNFDIGLMACVPMGLSFGVVVDHIINPKGEEKGIGLALATALNLNQLIALPLTLSFDWVMDDLRKDQLDHILAGGAEFILFEVLPFRLGYTSKLKQKDSMISFGTGLLFGGFALDGLYQQHLTISKLRNFGLALRFSF